jgi:hypothetical protein
MDRHRDAPASGDTVIIPMRNTNVWGVPRDACRTATPVELGLRAPLTTMGAISGAGFYSHDFGILPFGFNLGDSDTYWLMVVR